VLGHRSAFSWCLDFSASAILLAKSVSASHAQIASQARMGRRGCVGAESFCQDAARCVHPRCDSTHSSALMPYSVPVSAYLLPRSPRPPAKRTHLLSRGRALPAPRLYAKALEVESSDAKTFSSALLGTSKDKLSPFPGPRSERVYKPILLLLDLFVLTAFRREYRRTSSLEYRLIAAIARVVPRYVAELIVDWRSLNAPSTMSAPAQEQQQDAAPAAAAADAARQSIAADDNLACQWDKCSERCTSAEALFVCPILPNT
jgi:hypothetical protein